MGNFIRSVLSAASAILQSKTVTPTQSQQNVTPDAGYDGLSQVTVDPIPSEYVIPSAITPSDSSPVSMASGSAYKPSANGYAIQSYASITPSASGAYFSSGINKMSSSGYAYSSRPALSETTLYTNSSANSWSDKTVTLSDGISNYDYIKIYFKNSTSWTNVMSVIIPRSDLIGMDGTNYRPFIGIGGNQTSSYHYIRMVKYVSDTQLNFSKSYSLDGGSSSSAGNYGIPTKICGLK